MIPAIAIISCLLCLQGMRGSFKYFPKNALLSFCRNMKSAVHVPNAGWLISSCPALARTHDFKNFLSTIQVFCCKTFTMLWHDTSYRCLCVQSSMSSPWCERCLLITKSPAAPCYFRYLYVDPLLYPLCGIEWCSVLRLLVFLYILRFRILNFVFSTLLEEELFKFN